MTAREEYRGYLIEYDPPPIPLRSHDWSYWHRDFDGPGDPRHGTAPSADEARRQIDEQTEELL